MRRCIKFSFAPPTAISIHAPRMRCDFSDKQGFIAWRDFNPRTSYEMRLDHCARSRSGTLISIHAPRMRCDARGDGQASFNSHFNPRTSYEMRPESCKERSNFTTHFNPRTSYEMRQKKRFGYPANGKFQSTHLV